MGDRSGLMGTYGMRSGECFARVWDRLKGL